jgi:hypothetical protein
MKGEGEGEAGVLLSEEHVIGELVVAYVVLVVCPRVM